MTGRRGGGDPYWLRVKYACKCCGCGTDIKRGDEAFYYPNGRRMLCAVESCGKKASRDFEANRFDEAQVTGSW